MKIYVNNNYNILSIDKKPKSYFIMDETLGDFKDSRLYNMCDTCLYLWKHEPQYKIKVDSNGNIQKDEFGNIAYELDENGEKILIGWSTYPSVSLDIIDSIQKEYDRQQLEIQEAMKSVIDNDYRLSEMELKL